MFAIFSQVGNFSRELWTGKGAWNACPYPCPRTSHPSPLSSVSSLSWVSKSSCRANYVTPFCYLLLLPQPLYYYVFVVGNELSALSMQVLYSPVYVYSLSSEFRGACHCHWTICRIQIEANLSKWRRGCFGISESEIEDGNCWILYPANFVWQRH